MPVTKDSQKIQRMFRDISGRYDLLNHLLSLNIDRLWRRKAARALDIQPGHRLLDACTGTGDLALELCRHVDGAAGGHVTGTDFCREMVAIGQGKQRKASDTPLDLLVADTLALPFPDGTFDGATVAFGIRNVCDLRAGLEELQRVLRPGGRLVILEFTTARSAIFRKLFHLYFHGILPRIGALLSGHPTGSAAYRYLPESVAEFPTAHGLKDLMQDVGFETVTFRYLSFGIAALHVADKPASGSSSSRPEA